MGFAHCLTHGLYELAEFEWLYAVAFPDFLEARLYFGAVADFRLFADFFDGAQLMVAVFDFAQRGREGVEEFLKDEVELFY